METIFNIDNVIEPIKTSEELPPDYTEDSRDTPLPPETEPATSEPIPTE